MVTSLLLSLKYWKNDSLLFEQIRNLKSPILFTFLLKNEKWEKKEEQKHRTRNRLQREENKGTHILTEVRFQYGKYIVIYEFSRYVMSEWKSIRNHSWHCFFINTYIQSEMFDIVQQASFLMLFFFMIICQQVQKAGEYTMIDNTLMEENKKFTRIRIFLG